MPVACTVIPRPLGGGFFWLLADMLERKGDGMQDKKKPAKREIHHQDCTKTDPRLNNTHGIGIDDHRRIDQCCQHLTQRQIHQLEVCHAEGKHRHPEKTLHIFIALE